MAEFTLAQRQAGLLAAVAEHVRAHDVVLVSLGDLDLRWPPDLRTPDGGGVLARWARSVPVERLDVLPIRGQGWSVVSFRVALAGLGVKVWARVDALPRDVTTLTVAELAHFAEHATLPGPGGGS